MQLCLRTEEIQRRLEESTVGMFFFEATDNSAFKLGKAGFETYRETIIVVVIIIHYQ